MSGSVKRPVRLAMTPAGELEIEFNDRSVRRYTVYELRNACPCATCREKRSQPKPATLLPVLKPEEAQPLKLTGMTPVGNYAYSIHFSDGHDTGIYTFETLAELGTAVEG